MPSMIQNLLLKSTKPAGVPVKAELPAEGADFQSALKTARKEKPSPAEQAERSEPKKIARKPQSKDAASGEEDIAARPDDAEPVDRKTTKTESKDAAEPTDDVTATEPTDDTDAEQPSADDSRQDDAKFTAQVVVQPVTIAVRDQAAPMDGEGQLSAGEHDIAAATIQQMGTGQDEDADDAATVMKMARGDDAEAAVDPAAMPEAKVAKPPAGKDKIVIGDQGESADSGENNEAEAVAKSTDISAESTEFNAATADTLPAEREHESGGESIKPVGPMFDGKPLEMFNVGPNQTNTPHNATTTTAAAAPELSPEARFAAANNPNIVTGIRAHMLPNGGTMHLRLDPPELGALQVTVQMRDGVMTASFQTSSDDATRMLSHSLGDLRHVLETSGVSVEKLHVQQSPRDQQSTGEEGQQQQSADQHAQQQEQQRREMLRRMWRKLSGGEDPLDLVA